MATHGSVPNEFGVSAILPIPKSNNSNSIDSRIFEALLLVLSILVSSSQLVQTIANYCVMFGRYRSFLGTNALFCCVWYNWSMSESISNPEHIKYFSFKS